MFAKLPLSLLAISGLAAAASVTICNDPTGYCITLDTIISQPLDPVVTLPFEQAYGQRWFFNHDGALYNLYSGYVLEVPVDDSGNIIPGKALYMARPNGKSNQLWKIDDKGRLVSKHDECMAVWGMGDKINKPHNPIVVQKTNDNSTYQWTVKDFFPQQLTGCPELEGMNCPDAFNAANDQTVLRL
ncbi:hypothetical protein NP233_g7640 [Leucocoprinus birnbaumii]|uniref:Ricin B lectin domain-containing protein n=1 Tax=Leucocoprinus birnbaumii TaxID=56174 RepID=A0AAD5YSK5_9AGAR|nr:hypothetical protein NP233_g7640 [Leucocoprinus birnbaumii]